MIDVGRALKAPFEDPEWLSKTLLGLLWGLLVVTAPAVYGAQIHYLRDVSEDEERLPTWSEFGALWVDGLMAIIAGLVYFLPIVALLVVAVIPAALGYSAAGSNDAWAGLTALFAGTFCLVWVVAIIYVLGVSVLFSAALTNYAMKGGFGSFFEIGEIISRVRGGTGYFTAWAYTILVALIGSVLTSVVSATGVGAILSPGIAYLVAMASAHVLGQWAKVSYGTPSAAAHPASAIQPAAPAARAPFESPTPPAPAPPAPPAPPAAPELPVPAAPPVDEAVESQSRDEGDEQLGSD